MCDGLESCVIACLAAATGVATINSICDLGGFVGPAMIGWIKDQTGSFAGGLYSIGRLAGAVGRSDDRRFTQPVAPLGRSHAGALIPSSLSISEKTHENL